jgi:hypothetical protein
MWVVKPVGNKAIAYGPFEDLSLATDFARIMGAHGVRTETYRLKSPTNRLMALPALAQLLVQP